MKSHCVQTRQSIHHVVNATVYTGSALLLTKLEFTVNRGRLDSNHIYNLLRKYFFPVMKLMFIDISSSFRRKQWHWIKYRIKYMEHAFEATKL